MRRRFRMVVALALLAGVGLVPVAWSGLPGQHGLPDGHLPAVQRGVELLGRSTDFPGGALELVADVAAQRTKGNEDFAYLGAFTEPSCAAGGAPGGVHVIDMNNPKKPTRAGFLPSAPGTYVGEGVQVVDLNTHHFAGQVLVHNNEACLEGPGGVSLWDVTDPRAPVPLALHVGDTTIGADAQPVANEVHSAFAWQAGDRAFVVMTDDEELGTADVDILDITDPREPRLISETGLATGFPQAKQTSNPPYGQLVLLHDMIVRRVDGQWLLLGSYWDAGYVVLNVDDPARPVFVRDTDYAASEPFSDLLGLPAGTTPEGNAHQAELSHDNRWFIGADEDFDPFRVIGLVTSGPHQGTQFQATQGSATPAVDDETTVEGPTAFVGQACGPLVPTTDANQVALIERGTCTFAEKAQYAEAAGYAAGIVFNDKATDADCDALVNMLAVGTKPFLFVGRSTGLRLLGVDFNAPCATNAPVAPTPGESVRVSAVFDGWGYAHLFDARTMRDVGQYAIPEVHDRARAAGSGHLSVHEVATDPARDRAYFSWYSGGLRVADFGPRGIREVGAYIAEGGNNFWGVEVYQHSVAGQVVLASDRSSGLWIFRVTAP